MITMKHHKTPQHKPQHHKVVTVPKKVHHVKRVAPRSVEKAAPPRLEKEPEYMIQVGDPKMLRKDLLESLREVIIFMQGYETFRRIQEEKVALFTMLKSQVKEINSMVDNKLKKYLPKGKLRGISEKQMHPEEEQEETLPGEPRIEVVPIERVQRKVVERVAEQPVQKAPANELDELEKQLKDIENQLQNIQ